MGNNNVAGQQVLEEPAHGIDNIIQPSNGSPGLNNTNSEKSIADNEKDGTEVTDMPKPLKDSISNGGDEQVASDQSNSSSKIEGIDEKKRGSIQDNASKQDDRSSNLRKEDYELMKDKATETTMHSTKIITTVSATIEDMIRIKDSSASSEKVKQLVPWTRDRSEGNSSLLLEENIEGSLEDEESRSHENAPMGGNLAGKDTNEILQQGHIEVSTVEDQLMAMQGETTSSTESIVSTYLDADDSEIKEVIAENKPGQKDSPLYLQPLDATNMETSNNYITEIPQEKDETSAISKTTTVEPVTVSGKVIEEDRTINGYEDIPEYSACDNLYNGEFDAKFQPYLRNPIAVNEQELEKHELNEWVVASRKISDSVTETVDHSGIERTHNKEEGIIDKTLAVQNLADNFEREKGPEEYRGNLVSPVEVKGKDWTCLHSSSSDHLLIVNEEKEQREVDEVNECDKETVKEISEQGNKVKNAEGLGQHIDAQVAGKEGGALSNVAMTTPSTPLPLLEHFDTKGCMKLDSSDSNEGTIASTYEARTRDTQEIITSSQGDQSQQIHLEEHESVKLENCEIFSTCMQLVEDSPKIGKIFTDGSNHEKVGANTKSKGFTIESNQEGVTATTSAAGFSVECNQAKVTTVVDRAKEEKYPLHTSTPVTEASEGTPFLQTVMGICSFSHSTQQHGNVSVDMPMTDISMMQFKAEAKESEKSPLLSPKEPSGGDFREPNHSGRKNKPFQSLITEDRVGLLSPLKEEESAPNNNVLVGSPRSKGNQKTRNYLFTSCMCCATPTN